MERHISIIRFFLCYTVFVTAFGHSMYSRYAPGKKGKTEFPCTLPCPWRGKTFDTYNLNGVNNFPNWTIDASGKSGAIPIGLVFECYQINDRFIIFRIRGTDTFFCSTFFYDGSTDPVTFALNDVDPEYGAPRPNDPDVECNLPSYCEPSESCTSCAVCKNNGNVPKACLKNKCRDSFKRKGS